MIPAVGSRIDELGYPFRNVCSAADYAIMTEARQEPLPGAEPYMPIPEILQGRLRLPVIGAPMFIVSTPRLVLAQCKAGIVGSFPALNEIGRAHV